MVTRTFEKVGRHRARQGRPASPAPWSGPGEHRPAPGEPELRRRSKVELLELARRLGVRGRSRMSKAALVRALARAR